MLRLVAHLAGQQLVVFQDVEEEDYAVIDPLVVIQDVNEEDGAVSEQYGQVWGELNAWSDNRTDTEATLVVEVHHPASSITVKIISEMKGQ